MVKSLEQPLVLIRENYVAKVTIFLNQKLGDGWEKTDKKLVENLRKIGRKSVKRLGENQIKLAVEKSCVAGLKRTAE